MNINKGKAIQLLINGSATYEGGCIKIDGGVIGKFSFKVSKEEIESAVADLEKRLEICSLQLAEAKDNLIQSEENYKKIKALSKKANEINGIINKPVD